MNLMKTHSNQFVSPRIANLRLPMKLQEPYAQSRTEIKFHRTKARTQGRKRDWGCSAETDGEIACRNIALCGSRATLETRFGFRRQNDSSGVRSSIRRSKPSPTLAFNRTALYHSFTWRTAFKVNNAEDTLESKQLWP